MHGFADRASTWLRPDNALVSRLVEAGYRWDVQQLVPFSYPTQPGLADEDAEGDIAVAGQALARAVRDLAGRAASGQVDLLGFSMGGLVGRWAINSLRDESNGRPMVNTAVSLAAPNNGADILLWLARLGLPGQEAVGDLARDVVGLDLDSVGARQMMPRSEFLGQLNRPELADDRVRYVTVAGSVEISLRLLGLGAFEVGDGFISAVSAGYLPGLTASSYVLRDRISDDGNLWQALARSDAFHARLLYNDNAALAVAAELASWSALRAQLDEGLASGRIALV